MSVLAMQEADNFVLGAMAPFLPVDKQVDEYYVYDQGDWNRIEMAPRGSSERSRQAGWRLSTTAYSCKREAVSVGFDWSDDANADEVINTDLDASEYLANQSMMRGDQLGAAACFGAALWTTDWDGAAAKDYASNEVLYWSDSSADPQADHTHLANKVFQLTGKWPNVMVVGSDVLTALIGNSVVRGAIQYVKEAGLQALLDSLAFHFKVEKFLVAGGMYTSTVEGQSTQTQSQLFDADDVWCGYVNPTVGPRTFTAARTFAFKDGGRAKDGVVTRKFELVQETTTWSEIETFWDVKIIAADAAYFIDEAVNI
jgi:hypothetical protein